MDKSLAYARHYPAINWTSSYSEYLDDLAHYYETKVDPKFNEYRTEISTLLKEEQAAEETAAKVMPLSESDTRDTAPSAEAEQNERTNEQGRELKDILLLLFLLLLAAEMGVSRYVG